jgi:plastocyanin
MNIKLGIIVIALLAIVLIIVEVFTQGTQVTAPFVATNKQATTTMRIPPPQPVATASDTVAEQSKHPFSLLISYVDSGFEPATAHVHVGDTVRFTNNASGDLWVASSGTAFYPRTQDGCGSSDLDSCKPLSPGQFWEFTLMKKGIWQYANNLDKSKLGTIIVQ